MMDFINLGFKEFETCFQKEFPSNEEAVNFIASNLEGTDARIVEVPVQPTLISKQFFVVVDKF